MLRLGLPERPAGRHLGDDLPRPQARRLDVGDRVLGDPLLLVVGVEDGRAVAGADVVALPVPGRRVVDLEEELEQIAVGRLLGIEDDLDRLRVRRRGCGRSRWGRRRRCSRPAWRAPPAACGSDPASPRSTLRRGSPFDCCVHVLHPPVRCLTMSNEGRVDVVPGQRTTPRSQPRPCRRRRGSPGRGAHCRARRCRT